MCVCVVCAHNPSPSTLCVYVCVCACTCVCVRVVCMRAPHLDPAAGLVAVDDESLDVDVGQLRVRQLRLVVDATARHGALPGGGPVPVQVVCEGHRECRKPTKAPESAFVSLSLSVSLISVLSVCLSVCLSVRFCLSLSVSVCLCSSLSVCLSVCLSLSLSLCDVCIHVQTDMDHQPVCGCVICACARRMYARQVEVPKRSFGGESTCRTWVCIELL